jgi:predicted ribosomally synthesized peptide with nif11-like leader
MAKDPADSAKQLVDRLVNDAQFRESVTAAPTLHDQAEVIRAAGYGDVSLEAIHAAVKEQAAAMGAGVQVDPARVKRVEELFLKAATDQELRQALQAAATPEAKRAVLAQAGYGDITVDDLRAAAADLAQREELSDEELELVSGGASTGAAIGGAIGGATVGGAAIGATIGGPVGAAAGALVGFAAGVATVAATILPSAPPPSDW